MKISSSIKHILDSINYNRKIILVKYTPTLYIVLNILEKEFRLIKRSFIFKQWLFVIPELANELNKRYLSMKIHNSKSDKRFLSFERLKKYTKFNPYVIVHSTKGLCSASKALQTNNGGILYCVLYYVNKCS